MLHDLQDLQALGSLGSLTTIWRAFSDTWDSWRRAGLADKVGSDAIPDAAGGEAGHGAAKLDPVIHRYVFYLIHEYSAI